MSVHRREDDAFLNAPPAGGLGEDLDAWLDEAQQRTLYSAPLGADGTMHAFWCTPAQRLGWRQLAAIYGHGLQASGDQLVELLIELDHLEQAWTSDPTLTVARAETPPDADSATRVEVGRAHLTERAGVLRSAISIAIEAEAVLTIS